MQIFGNIAYIWISGWEVFDLHSHLIRILKWFSHNSDELPLANMQSGKAIKALLQLWQSKTQRVIYVYIFYNLVGWSIGNSVPCDAWANIMSLIEQNRFNLLFGFVGCFWMNTSLLLCCDFIEFNTFHFTRFHFAWATLKPKNSQTWVRIQRIQTHYINFIMRELWCYSLVIVISSFLWILREDIAQTFKAAPKRFVVKLWKV